MSEGFKYLEYRVQELRMKLTPVPPAVEEIPVFSNKDRRAANLELLPPAQSILYRNNRERDKIVWRAQERSRRRSWR